MASREPSPAAPASDGDGTPSTAVALFEAAIDAERALSALRKANQSADRVSLLIRNRNDEREPADGAVDVARDIVGMALGAVANWLIGLAELIVPERGRYVVAGPMGAALTGIGRAQAAAADGEHGSCVLAADLNADSLQWVLTEFGFTAQAADYVEHRLTAGATLVAITTSDADELATTRGIFGDHDAVHIGVAETGADVLAAAKALLASAPALADGGTVVVVDVVARVRPVAETDALAASRGRAVVLAGGVEVGQVEGVLVEDVEAGAGADGTEAVPRYVVIGFGGVLGLRRRKVVVPAELVELGADPVVIRLDKAVLQRAPAYDVEVPLSRSGEEQIFRYFDVTPYWSEAEAEADDPAESAGSTGGVREE